MRFVLFAALALAACGAEKPTPPAGPSILVGRADNPILHVEGSALDIIEIRPAARCWIERPDNYCESLSRRLDRDQAKMLDPSADIVAQERAAAAAREAAK